MQIIVRVRELRKHHHLTQEELAKQLNISRQSLISLEQGRWLPSLPLAIQLAEFFREPLEDVIRTMPVTSKVEDKGVEKGVAIGKDVSPWGSLTDAREHIDQPFDQDIHFPLTVGTTFPMINVRQDEKQLYLEAHTPGFTREQIDIDVADEFVTISGTAISEGKNNSQDYLRQEYRQQSFSRTFGLPLPVISDEATADMRNGVLTITLPKVQEERPKTKRIKPTGE